MWRNFDPYVQLVGTNGCCRKWSEDGSCFCACGCVLVGLEVKRPGNFSDSVVNKDFKKLRRYEFILPVIFMRGHVVWQGVCIFVKLLFEFMARRGMLRHFVLTFRVITLSKVGVGTRRISHFAHYWRVSSSWCVYHSFFFVFHFAFTLAFRHATWFACCRLMQRTIA
jgi:hypothetical protein